MGNKKEAVGLAPVDEVVTPADEVTDEVVTPADEVTDEVVTDEVVTDEVVTDEVEEVEEVEEVDAADNKVQTYAVAKCDRVYVRKSHTKESEPVDSLPSGTVVFGLEIVKDVTDAWVKVSYNNGENVGYIMRKYLSREVKA